MKVWHVKQSKVYHTDEECMMFNRCKKKVQTWDKETAEAWGHTECRYCDPEVDVWPTI